MEDYSDYTVLVVDDAEVNVDVLVEALGDIFDIAVALDGESALEIAVEDPLHCILLDIMMPEMDGFEVMEQLKSMPATKDIPVIFLTGAEDDATREKGMSMGAVDFILKPFDTADVIARIKKALSL